MSNLTLSKIRFFAGIWEGRLEGATAEPKVEVRHLDTVVPGVDLRATEPAGAWHLSVPIPKEAIADGVQSFVIYDAEAGVKLGDFTLIAGEPLADDLRAEVALLRAELDMLKRAFRRHCLETT